MTRELAMWCLVVVLILLGVGGVMVLARRRRTPRVLDRQERIRLAARAVRQITDETKRTRRGSLRGKGGGGDDSRSRDAGYGSDSGAGGL